MANMWVERDGGEDGRMVVDSWRLRVEELKNKPSPIQVLGLNSDN